MSDENKKGEQRAAFWDVALIYFACLMFTVFIIGSLLSLVKIDLGAEEYFIIAAILTPFAYYWRN
jgi:hypothetical protein